MTKNYGSERLEALHKQECEAEQVRYLYLNVPGVTFSEISKEAQVSFKRVQDIVKGDPRFQGTVLKRREHEFASSRLVRAEKEEKLRRLRERG